jgi:hypothetical protein
METGTTEMWPGIPGRTKEKPDRRRIPALARVVHEAATGRNQRALDEVGRFLLTTKVATKKYGREGK